MEHNNENQKRYCEYCNTEITDETKVCPVCGSKVISDREEYEEERIRLYEKTVEGNVEVTEEETVPVEEETIPVEETIHVNEEEEKQRAEILARRKELRSFCNSKLFLWLTIICTACAVAYALAFDIINLVGYIMLSIAFWKMWNDSKIRSDNFEEPLKRIAKAISIMHKITKVVCWIIIVCGAIALLGVGTLTENWDEVYAEITINYAGQSIELAELLSDYAEYIKIIYTVAFIVMIGMGVLILYLSKIFYLACLRFVNGINYSNTTGSAFSSKGGFGVAIYLIVMACLSGLSFITTFVSFLSGDVDILTLVCTALPIAGNALIAVTILQFKKNLSRD